MATSYTRYSFSLTVLLLYTLTSSPVASFLFETKESATPGPSECTLTPEVICSCPLEGHRGTADCSSKAIKTLPSPLAIPSWASRLDFSRNNITEIVQGQFSLAPTPSLVEIDISRNIIENIHVSAFLDLRKLESLDLSHNKIKVLPAGAFQGLDSLQKLDLSNNLLTILPKDIFTPIEGLRHLSLSFNPVGMSLSTQDDTDKQFLTPLRELDELYLRNCSITTVPEVLLQNSSSLRVLSLADNPQIEDVPKTSFPYIGVTLESLDLSGCGMKAIPSHSFHGLFELLELTLERLQKLERVDKFAFRDLAKLRSLSLSRCPRLSVVDVNAFRADNEDAYSLYSLRELRMASCALRHLEPRTADWKKLDVVDLQGNPWHCDCHMVWLQKLNISQEFRTDLICTSPSVVAGFNLLDASLPKLECIKHTFTEETVRIFLLAILDILVLALVVAGAAILLQLLGKLRCGKCKKNKKNKKMKSQGYKRVRATKGKVDLEWDHGDIGDV